jgi:hypothetical protein
MDVNGIVQARIAAAVRKRQHRRRQRAELDEARTHGLAARHAAKTARQTNNNTPAASGA